MATTAVGTTQSQRTDTRTGRTATRPKRRAGAAELPVLLALSSALLLWGWLTRNTGDLTAETGPGYLLGIAGSVLMLILLIYPLRKRIPGLRLLGGVRGWFRVHMILGVAGPVLVLLHSNFNLGSLNSTIALATMLVVASSGLIGRFLYGRIHHGLYGRRAELGEHRDFLDALKRRVGDEVDGTEAVRAELRTFEARRLDASQHLVPAMIRVISGPVVQIRLRRRLVRRARKENELRGKDLRVFRNRLNDYLVAAARVEAFIVYERLFALWHLLHLPLFIIMVVAAIGHVVAVHLY